MANAPRMTALSMSPILAREVAAQIDAGVSTPTRMVALSMAPELAREVGVQIDTGIGIPKRLLELSMPFDLAREVAAQIDAASSPLSLFVAEGEGLFYNPSKLSSVWQDPTGTIPGAIGQPVGRIDDQSGNGHHAAQATAASRPILRQNTVTGAYYLEFDGVNDSLSTTAAVDFTATDAVTVTVGARKLSDAATAVLFELSADSQAGSGTFAIFAPTAAIEYRFRSRGTASADVNADNVAFAAPHSAVLTGIGDIGSDTAVLRMNGAQVAIVATDQGAGNYGNHILHIGRRNAATLPFTGHLYGVIVLGRAASSTEIADTEQWMATRVGVSV